jgi:hypothetical protein
MKTERDLGKKGRALRELQSLPSALEHLEVWDGMYINMKVRLLIRVAVESVIFVALRLGPSVVLCSSASMNTTVECSKWLSTSNGNK